MMRYLLDTNVLSNLRKVRPNQGLVEWMDKTPSDALLIPVPAIFEIQLGIELLRRDGKTQQADDIEHWLAELLAGHFNENLIPLDAECARLQAKLFADPKLRHFVDSDSRSTKLKSGQDLIVAAMAIVHGAAIVSFDADFQSIHERFPLPGLFHPGRGEWFIQPRDEDP